ncbi:MAG: hypothetical protein WDN00_09820 [Limisphaerales bacterium]
MKSFILLILSIPLGAFTRFPIGQYLLDNYFRRHGTGNSHDDLAGAAITCGLGLILGATILPSIVGGVLKCCSKDLGQKRVGTMAYCSTFGFIIVSFHPDDFFLAYS